MLQYVQLVSNVSLSCILYMFLPFDVGIIYLLDVNKCTHLLSSGIHSTFIEILLWSATEQVTGNYRYKNILLLYYIYCKYVSYILSLQTLRSHIHMYCHAISDIKVIFHHTGIFS